MAASAVEHITEADALRRRLEILALVGDESSFRERAAAYLLQPSDQALFDELEDLTYLLAL